MNIEKELLAGKSKQKILEVAKYIKQNENKLKELVKLLKSNDEFLQYRVSWCLSVCYDNKIQGLNLYCEYYILILNNETSSSVKRNILRILQWIKIPKDLHGMLINKCFCYIEDINEPIAVKAFSFSILEKMCGYYPELINETLLVCEKYKNSTSPGIKSRVNRIFKILVK